MPNTSSRFKFLRCLVLCLGFATGPANVMAQVVTLESSEFNDTPDANLVEDAGESSKQKIRESLGIAKPKELTFEYLSPDNSNHNNVVADEASNKASIGLPDDGDEAYNIVADAKGGKRKRAKKHKKFKRAKKGKGYCNVFFQGTITKGAEFKAVGDFSSATLIQIFDDEAEYQSGGYVLQTIEYSSSSVQSISVGDQLGSLTIKDYQTRELTFEYLSFSDSNYTDVVTSQTGEYSIIGIPDDDDNAYIVVSDAKGGKGCKKFKKYKKGGKGGKRGKRGSIPFEQTTTTNSDSTSASNSRSETLIQIFENDNQPIFADVRRNYWASNFIYRLASIKVIEGFPGADFQPDANLTQAQFATIVSKAFNVPSVREVIPIGNLSRSYWAYNSIQKAHSMGFIEISNNTFNPDRYLTKLDVLVAIAKGLGYTQVSSNRSVNDILNIFTDGNTIPAEYRGYIATLVEKGVLVNYPNTKTLNLTQVISRAETSALVHQALVSLGQIERINSNYIIN